LTGAADYTRIPGTRYSSVPMQRQSIMKAPLSEGWVIKRIMNCAKVF